LWSIELGDVSPAIKTEYGYHLIKVFERRDSSYTPLDDELYGRLEAQIRSGLNKNVAVEYLDSLRALATVKYNETLLARADSTYDEMAWLAVVNNVDTIFVHDYSNQARTYQMRNRLAKMEVSHKKEILGRMADLLIIDVEAKKLGYYDFDDVKEELADFIWKQKEHQFRLLGELPGWEPTEDEIKAYYDENIDSYNAEKPLHVQHIVFKDSLKAEEIRKKIEDGEDFREMALKYYPGEEEIRETLFDLGYISSQEMPASFWNAAWILDVGDVSRPVKTEYGYHLIKLLDRKPTTPFDQAKSQVKREMIEAKREAKKNAWREELLAGHSVEVDSALVREFVFQKNAGRDTGRDPAPDSSATP
jgi:parvulin-like peptidyl-prolyl isomerase